MLNQIGFNVGTNYIVALDHVGLVGIINKNLVLFIRMIDKCQDFGGVVGDDDIDYLFLLCDEASLDGQVLEEMGELLEPVFLHSLVGHFFDFNDRFGLSLNFTFRFGAVIM